MDRLKRDSFFNFFANGVRVILSFVTTLILARALGAHDFGEVNLLLGYTVFFNYFLALGFDHTLAYYLPRFQIEETPWLTRDILGTVVWSAISIAAVLMLLAVFFLKKPLAVRGIEHLYAPALIIGGQTLFTALTAVTSGYFRGMKSFSTLILKDQLLFPFTHLIGSVVAFHFWPGGTLAYAWVYAFTSFTSLAYGVWHVLRTLPPSPTVHAPSTSLKARLEWLSFSLPIGLTQTLEPLLPWGTIIMLGWYLLPQEVGQFAVCMRVSVFIQFFLLAVGPIFSPYLAEHFQRKHMDLFKRLYQSVNFFCSLWSLLLAAVIFTVGDAILEVFGHEYHGALLCFQIMLAASLLEGAFGSIKQSLIMAGNTRVNLVNVSIGVLANGLIGLWLIPSRGIVGAALGNFFGYLVINLLRAVQFGRIFQIAPFDRTQSFKLIGAGLLLGGFAALAVGRGWGLPLRIAAVILLLAGSAAASLVQLRAERRQLAKL